MNKFGIISLTKNGSQIARKVHEVLPESELFIPDKYALAKEKSFPKGGFKTCFTQIFQKFDCVICVMATGIVVRSIAGLVQDKTIDPAVLVMDEQANHVISLLSGHVGGANEWANELATLMNSDPVITTATDTEHVQALDVLADKYDGWYAEFKRVTKRINGRLADGLPVALYIEPSLVKNDVSTTGFTVLEDINQRSDNMPLIVISDRINFPKMADTIFVVPKVNVVGVGCRKDVSFSMMQEAFSAFCEERKIAWQSIVGIASIEKKEHEQAIHYLGRVLDVVPQFYTAEQLSTVESNYPQSAFVKKTVGVGSVAETSADIAANSRVVGKRFAHNEITFALAQKK
ncbi:CbiG protein [Furfurilactobacillus siliginis]|uniref:CbiG protein n=2 Tax=Furfurilactobacillus siliginis TaxID=348151 RepID=A0A0R2LA28_9LACO|nr:cobalt-precorrin 5A hydrolase [Furfurilactobacillus siliginis]KRN96188.1 CbiG protein [Furfurilactobacillus siliginis]GEK27887.1 cobalamin biosynthesis protein CbiG [Furfurilactobacillus siliginis]